MPIPPYTHIQRFLKYAKYIYIEKIKYRNTGLGNIIAVLVGYWITRGDFDTYKGNIPSVIVYWGIIKDVNWE